MRRLALVLALGLVMVGLLLAAAGGISGPGNDARSASYDELAADAPTGFSGETSALSVEPPSVRLLDQMWSDYVYDTPAVARVGARVAPGDGGVSSPAVPGDGAVAVPASAAEGAATTLSALTYTPSGVLSRSDRLNEVFNRLGQGPRPRNADEALGRLSRTLDDVEDAYSGVPRNPSPGLRPDGRMYPPQADNIVRHADGSITATSRGHTIQIDAGGRTVITDRATGQVVFDG